MLYPMSVPSIRKAFMEGVLCLSDGSKVASLYQYQPLNSEVYFGVRLEGEPNYIERLVSRDDFRYLVIVTVTQRERTKETACSTRFLSIESALVELIEYVASVRAHSEVYIRLDAFGALVNVHHDWDVSGIFQIDFVGGAWGKDADSAYALACETLVTREWQAQTNGSRYTRDLPRD